jgi:hypothetical protein
MSADPILTLAWLVLAHLVGDFVLQTAGMVAAKAASGGRAVRGLLGHGAGVAVALIPVALAFGWSGLWAVLFITISHVLVDRAKVLTTRRAEARALADAHRRHEGRAPAAGLGRAWTPLPAALFLLDQLAHGALLVVAWAIWLAGLPPTPEWAAAVGDVLGGRDLAAVHDVTLGIVVVAALVLVNVRAGAMLVATLVRPLESSTELAGGVGGATAVATPASTAGSAPAGPGRAAPGPAAGREGSAASERRRGWSFRIGPLAGRVVPDAPPSAPDARPDTAVVAGERVALPPPAQVGATIGVIERLLIVMFVLVGADAAIGFVVGAKTIARFKQLDDRDFAEYYLLGTLASVTIAIVTAIVARAALAG